MSLFRYIKQGVGWELGRRAVKEGLEQLAQKDEDAKATAERTSSEAATADDQKAARGQAEARDRVVRARVERERKAAAAQREREAQEIDDELAALKRRLAKEGRLPKNE